ncbi:MAG: UPF0262 family protein [Alphaproteobacteria bacterium]|nr:UPF0262 family protein [Alphaproteobacteria bacterium]
MSETFRISKIDLDERSVVRRAPEVEHERAVAIFDLIEDNMFAPKTNGSGPFHVVLSLEDNRLVFDVREEDGVKVDRILIALSGFKRIVKDYFEVCESYFEAIKTASPSKIEAIDMGRRGLHNEGSELLRERLAEKVEVDFDTARRLFTLLCVLQIRG